MNIYDHLDLAIATVAVSLASPYLLFRILCSDLNFIKNVRILKSSSDLKPLLQQRSTKTKGFLTFSGDIEMELWAKMG